MRTCPACSFENMNTAVTCGRCGAKLVWDGPTDRESFRPPRAGQRKALYTLAYFYSAKTPWLRTLPRTVITALRRLPSERVTAAALSIVPGLGHWHLGEKEEGLRLGLIWLATFMAAVFFYFFMPRLLLAVAPLLWAALMSIHSFAVISAARPRFYCRSAWEVLVVSLVLLGLTLVLYLVAGHIIQSFLQVRITVLVMP